MCDASKCFQSEYKHTAVLPCLTDCVIAWAAVEHRYTPDVQDVKSAHTPDLLVLKRTAAIYVQLDY